MPKQITREKFTLDIDLGNDAMQTADDVAEALRRVAKRLEADRDLSSGLIRDLNGNTVGVWVAE